LSNVKKRILIVDKSDELVRVLREAEGCNYEIAYAKNGEEALSKFSAFEPTLILTALMVPGMDGIEIIKRARAHPSTANSGIILISYQPLIQVYHAAVTNGANYFQERPCSEQKIRDIVKWWYEGVLKLAPFHHPSYIDLEGEHCYVPRIHTPDHYIRFWGTRGSSPVAGAEYVRYGGNSPCLEVRSGDDLIIIDAGTGIRPLGEELAKDGIRHVHLFLGHTHWDHIIGFPFFPPLYNQNCKIDIWAPVGYDKSIRSIFVEMLTYAYFPVRLEDIHAKITFRELRDSQTIQVGKLRLHTHYAFHPGSTLCFKIETGNTTVGYVTDNEMLLGFHGHPNAIEFNDPRLDPHRSLIEFMKNVDILVHEAQYDSFEYLDKAGWGHSSISNASVLIKYCQPKEWIVTHHDPCHTDKDLHEKREVHSDVLADCHVSCNVRMAFDGFMLPM